MKATPTTRRALLGTVLAVGTLGASGCVPLLIGGGATEVGKGSTFSVFLLRK